MAQGSSRKVWIYVAGAVVVAALAVLAVRARQAGAERYRTMPVERGAIEMTVSATGTINPVVQVEVGSQVSGTIARLGADYNDHVKKGQVLAQLEPSLFRTAVAQAEANLARAQAGLADADRTLRRSKELRTRNVIAQVDLDAAQAAYDQRAADVKQMQAALQSARVNLDHATITSPIEGIVVARSVDVGQTVAASLQAPQLFQIAGDLTRMQVETRIDEADIGRVRAGLKATFSVDAFPDDTFEGTVRQVRFQPLVDQNVVTYTTVIDVANPELKLKPGMTANVTVHIERRDDVLKVPNAALRFRPADATVRNVGRESTAVRATGAAGGGAAGAPGGAPDSSRGARRGPGGSGGGWRRQGGDSGAGGWRGQGGAARGPGAPESQGGAGFGGHGGRAGAPMQVVYVQSPGGELKPVRIATGLTDGSFTEIVSGDLAPGANVVVGLAPKKGQTLTPPPGMGGFGGPGGPRGGGGRRG